MGKSASRRIFVSYSLSDPTGPLVRHALADHDFGVITASTASTNRTPTRALAEVLGDVDSVVVVLPPPGDRSRTNVIFEAGVAVGRGLPVLLVAPSAELPADLRDLPFLRLDDLERLPAALDASERALRDAERNPPPDWNARRAMEELTSDVAYSRFGVASRPPSKFASLDESALLDVVRQLLTDSDTRVLVPERRADVIAVDTPDLVLWNDGLLSSFGLPVPVEVLRRLSSSRAVLSRLRRTLRASGARSLLAVAADGDGNVRWSSGKELILVITAESLESAVRSLPIASALPALLESARS
jgi:hypothetical protein